MSAARFFNVRPSAARASRRRGPDPGPVRLLGQPVQQIGQLVTAGRCAVSTEWTGPPPTSSEDGAWP